MKSLLVGFIVCFMQLPLFRVKLYYNVCVWNFPEGRGTTCFPFQSLGLFDISHHRYNTFSYPLLFLTHSNHLHGVFYGIVENFSKNFFRLPIVNICYITTLFFTPFSLYFPFFSFIQYILLDSINISFGSVRFGFCFTVNILSYNRLEQSHLKLFTCCV